MAALEGNLQVLEKLWKCANETLIRKELGKKLLLATDIMEKKCLVRGSKGGQPTSIREVMGVC
jgi:hypothetical protein